MHPLQDACNWLNGSAKALVDARRSFVPAGYEDVRVAQDVLTESARGIQKCALSEHKALGFALLKTLGGLSLLLGRQVSPDMLAAAATNVRTLRQQFEELNQQSALDADAAEELRDQLLVQLGNLGAFGDQVSLSRELQTVAQELAWAIVLRLLLLLGRTYFIALRHSEGRPDPVVGSNWLGTLGKLFITLT